MVYPVLQDTIRRFSAEISNGVIGQFLGRSVTHFKMQPLPFVVASIVVIATGVFVIVKYCVSESKPLANSKKTDQVSDSEKTAQATLTKLEELKESNLNQPSAQVGNCEKIDQATLTKLEEWKESYKSVVFVEKAIERIKKNLSEEGNELDLSGLYLTSLPDIFGLPHFKKLKTLDLSCNYLKTLPVEIGNLNALTNLNLSNNQLKTLPAEIGKLNALTNLDLSYNKLKTLPVEIGNLNALTNLNLSHNKLTALPAGIGNLIALTNLNLSHNKLTALPAGIGNLIALTNLSLSRNKLTALPAEIGNLTALTNLLLSNNQLTILPAEIGKLAALTNLSLFKNQLTILPAEIGKLAALITLDLDYNKLTALPAEIGNLTALTNLLLSNNQLAALPAGIGNLITLTNLNLSHNKLTALPAGIGNLIALTNLSLSRNKLTALPAEIGNLTALTNLLLSNNQLAALPAEIGNLTALVNLDLTDNRSLTGLPDEILQLQENCSILLENVGLSEAVLGRLREACNQAGYTGPRFHFSMVHANPYNPEEQKPVDELLQELYRNLDRDPVKLDNLLIEGVEKNRLQSWLSKISFMADYKASPERKKWLSNIVLNHVELANKDPEYRITFNLVIQDAATTCGDRMALSVIHLGIMYQLALYDYSNMKGLAELLKRGVFAMKLLEDCAKEKIKTLRFVDEIEVYLAYPVYLKERLKLPIDVEEMLFRQCSEVTDKDLEQAYNQVQSKLDDEAACYEFLIQNDYWKKALELKFKDAYTTIEYKYDKAKDEADKVEEFVQIENDYKQELLDLTKQALS